MCVQVQVWITPEVHTYVHVCTCTYVHVYSGLVKDGVCVFVQKKKVFMKLQDAHAHMYMYMYMYIAAFANTAFPF